MKKKNKEGSFICSCGSFPLIYEFSGEYRHHNDGMWDVECPGCGIELRKCQSREGAIRAWNNTVGNLYTLEPGVIGSIEMLIKYLHNHSFPALGLAAAWNTVSRFLKENTQE